MKCRRKQCSSTINVANLILLVLKSIWTHAVTKYLHDAGTNIFGQHLRMTASAFYLITRFPGFDVVFPRNAMRATRPSVNIVIESKTDMLSIFTSIRMCLMEVRACGLAH